MLHIEVRDSGSVALVGLWGCADRPAVGELRRVLGAVVQTRHRPVVEVDAAHLSMIDARCLLTIAVAEVAARLDGGQLCVVNASGRVAVACASRPAGLARSVTVAPADDVEP